MWPLPVPPSASTYPWAPGRSRGQILKPSRFLDEILAYGRERAAR